jgi:phosphoribosylformylglycinamidine cyclo-ligase
MLVGGETAEHPGVMEPDAFDLAGFCVGIAERDRLIDGSGTRDGDLIVGIASSGLHANGYSLVRAALRDAHASPNAPLASLDEPFHGTGTTLGQALLEPTAIYAQHVLAVVDALEGSRGLHGIAHITGGGLPGNLPRALAPGLGAVVHPGRGPVPAVMTRIAALAGLDGPGMRATFNGGIGMALVVEPAAASSVVELLVARGQQAWVIGDVAPADATGPSRYREEAG